MLPATEVPTTDLDEGSRFEPWRTAAAAICVTAATSGAFWALAAGRRLGPLPTGLLALGTVAGVCWTHLAPCGPGVPPPLANAPGGPWAAITFDDGPSQETGRILDALAAAGARATFFVLGSRARACPEMIRRIVAEGHSLGVHGDRHEPMVFRSGAWLRGAIDGARGAIREAAPAAAARFYRPPWGLRRPGLAGILRERGLRLVLWNLDSHDYAAAEPRAVADRVLRLARPGSVVLMHDSGPGGANTAAALPRILEGLQAEGLRCRSLDDLLEERQGAA